jgi:hypothetical protein
VRAIEIPLALGGRSGSDDPDSALLWFRVDDDHDPAIDRTDRDEAVLVFRMRSIEDLEIVDAGFEEPSGFCEGQAVLSPVAAILRRIPLELHGPTISQ